MAEETYTDAIAMLKADHRRVEDLFQKFCKAGSTSAKWPIAEQICNELKIHATLEEEIFYPAFEGKIDDDLWHEAYVEHDGAKVLINDIMASEGKDDFFAAKVTVLCEEISHHVEEEEKPGEGYFYQARETGADMVELRDRMLAKKEELLAQVEAGGLPPAKLAAVQFQPA